MLTRVTGPIACLWVSVFGYLRSIGHMLPDGIGDTSRSTMEAFGRVGREAVCFVIGGAACCPPSLRPRVNKTQSKFAGLPLSGLCHDSGRTGPVATDVPARVGLYGGCHMGDGEADKRARGPDIEEPTDRTKPMFVLVLRLCEHLAHSAHPSGAKPKASKSVWMLCSGRAEWTEPGC